jgi:hypothetical protein
MLLRDERRGGRASLDLRLRAASSGLRRLGRRHVDHAVQVHDTRISYTERSERVFVSLF